MKERKDLLDDLREKYVKVRKLLDLREDEKLAATEAALKRKNEAVDILKEMRIKLEDAVNSEANRESNLVEMLAVVWLDIGIVSIDNEELKTGEENLMHCIDALCGRETTPEGVLPALSALNQLGIVWFQWTDLDKAESFLKKSQKIYKEYVSLGNPKPVAMASLFEISDEELNPEEILDKLHTLTLYYLAQIYGVNKDHQKSAKYCHMTLQRQLNHSDLDHIDWALNAATLSQFFMEKGGFPQARHHLAAASLILKKHEDSLGEPPKEGAQSDDSTAAKWEHFRHRSADVARCWAKYGILLMSSSRDRLIELSENAESEKRAETEDDESNEKDGFFEKMKFTSLEKDLESIANQVTDKYLLDFNDAKGVFLNVQHWLDEARKYYTFESHASDYVQIIGDMSQAFKHLSFFEDNEERQAKMHKRRIDILEAVVNELNPRYYQAECRQMWIELAETYLAILNIKLDRLRASDDRPTPHAIKKINSHAQSAINYFQRFLDSLKESENAPPVTKFTEEMARPALFAYFHLGTLYNKIITPDKNAQYENIKKSIEAYKFFVDYCESNEELAEFMKAELNVCKELVNLLPLKMDKVKQAISVK